MAKSVEVRITDATPARAFRAADVKAKYKGYYVDSLLRP
jgi:Arc/MetJ family transcription regulator